MKTRSYDQSLRVARACPGDTTVMIVVDRISRKYFTSETSCFWDIDFELLEHDNIKRSCLPALMQAIWRNVFLTPVLIRQSLR